MSLPPGILPKIPLLIERDCAKHAAMTLMLRGNIFYLRRNLPKRYASVDPRREVWITLKTDSQTEAKRRALGAWDQTILRWEWTSLPRRPFRRIFIEAQSG